VASRSFAGHRRGRLHDIFIFALIVVFDLAAVDPGHRGTSHKTTAAAGIERVGKLRKDPRC
jgi:hypothetical protein